ncbi:unnamed protein product [Symbiodinium microadriaticum]|nr:unnamed protein product [Symbiodinium microadriaticum]
MSFGRAFKQTYEIYIEWVQERGGLLVNGTWRPVEIRVGNDMSEAENVRAVFERHVYDGVNLWLSTYSSGLSLVAADVANSSGSLLIANSASSTAITRDRPTVFNVNPPARNYMRGSFEALAASGIGTIAGFYEASGGPRAVCRPLQDLASEYNMTLLSNREIPFSANGSVVKDLVAGLKSERPDAVFGCVYEQVCHEFVEEMLEQQFEPKAVIFTVCVTSDSISQLGAKGRWLTGVTSWLPSMPHQSEETGFSAAEFGALYRSKYTEDPPYQAAAAWAAIVSLGRAVEMANSTEPAVVSAQLQRLDLETLYGRVSFDEHGQTPMNFKAVQLQEVGMPPAVVSPLHKAVAPLCPDSSFSLWDRSLRVRRCIFCPPGGSLDQDGVCLPCAPGKVSITAGQMACTNCSAGYYADSMGQSRCEICPVGTFSSSSGLTQCTNCTAGLFNNEAAQTSCRSCAPGTISTEDAASKCTPCSSGEYAPSFGMTFCSQCQAGFTTFMEGSSAEEQCVCPKDSYRDGDTCTACGFLQLGAAKGLRHRQTTARDGAEAKSVCSMSPERLPTGLRCSVAGATATAGLLFTAAGPALVWAYTQRIRRRLKAAEERHKAVLESKVTEGVGSITELAHCMVLTRADIFMDLSFEQLGKEGMPPPKIEEEEEEDEEEEEEEEEKEEVESEALRRRFAIRKKLVPLAGIVFLSYQWLSWNRHGPNATQFEAMRQAVARYAESMELTVSEVYVWLDVLSIPQHHKGVQLLAVNSLYTYASSADALLIVAPDSVHAETGQVANLQTYKSRVWTRMEQIAHLTAHDLSSMLISSETGLEPVTEQWVRDVVRLFDGEMTCCRLNHHGKDICDKETLVVPLLGVWFVLRSWMDQKPTGEDNLEAPKGAQLVYRLMRDQMDTVFPPTPSTCRWFQFNTKAGIEERVPWMRATIVVRSCSGVWQVSTPRRGSTIVYIPVPQRPRLHVRAN